MSMSNNDSKDHMCWRFEKVNTDRKTAVLI